MSKPADVAIDALEQAVEEALSDHHLDEVAEMIERSHTDKRSLEPAFSDSPVGSNHRS